MNNFTLKCLTKTQVSKEKGHVPAKGTVDIIDEPGGQRTMLTLWYVEMIGDDFNSETIVPGGILLKTISGPAYWQYKHRIS